MLYTIRPPRTVTDVCRSCSITGNALRSKVSTGWIRLSIGKPSTFGIGLGSALASKRSAVITAPWASLGLSANRTKPMPGRPARHSSSPLTGSFAVSSQSLGVKQDTSMRPSLKLHTAAAWVSVRRTRPVAGSLTSYPFFSSVPETTTSCSGRPATVAQSALASHTRRPARRVRTSTDSRCSTTTKRSRMVTVLGTPPSRSCHCKAGSASGRLSENHAHSPGKGFQTPVVASKVMAATIATNHPVLAFA